MTPKVACDALRSGKRLEILYDGFSRIVEVHAVGLTKHGDAVMRVWQVGGGSVHNEPIGWKLLRLDETRGLSILNEDSIAPRQGYQRGDRAMASISCQI